MVNANTIPQRIEILFWAASIRLMKGSPALARLVRLTYPLLTRLRRFDQGLRLALLGAGGLAAGLSLAWAIRLAAAGF